MAELTIVSVAYPLSPVSVDSVGGAEQILAALDAAIVRAGHRSLVIAHERSRVAGALVPIADAGPDLDAASVGRVHRAVEGALARVLREERVDVVHVHGIDFDRYLPPAGAPLVATLHLPIAWYARDALRPARPDVHLCCVSRTQSRDLPSWAAPSSVIDNGVALEALRPAKRKRGYLFALGRICEEKRLHEALDAATAAGAPLVLAGETSRWEAHRRYFAEQVAPRLRPPHRWIGPVGLARKRRLLAGARCLLVPSRAPETSSLVAMEALASGTPVVAYPSGALAHIVEHGKTGYLVDDAQAMASAIARVSELSPEQCRRSAEERFSSQRMTAAYLTLYERLAPRRPVRGARPRPAERAPELTVEAVHGDDALARVAPEWAKLWRLCPWATPFQRPEWLLAYARAFSSPTASAWAVTCRSDGALVAILPLRTEEREDGRVTVLLGAGVSDYLDVVARPEVADAAVERMLREVLARAGGPLLFDALRPASPLLSARAPAGLRDERFDREPCPTLAFAGKSDPLPKAMRDKLRYYRRRAEALGVLEIHEAPGTASVGPWLERLFELHGERWSRRGEDGVLGSASVRRFHRDAIGGLAYAGHARIYGLSIGGRACAAMLALRDARATYHYIGGFDPALEAISPGTLLLGHVVGRAHGEGAAELDFLRGAEPYKYRFGAEDRPTKARRLARP